MRLNCALVAVALWYRARFRSGIAIKRSEGLHGLIPHFIHLRERKRRRLNPAERRGIYATDLIIEDYIPVRRKDGILDQGDSFLVFDGLFRTRVYRLVAVSTAGTLIGARRGALALATRSRRTPDVPY